MYICLDCLCYYLVIDNHGVIKGTELFQTYRVRVPTWIANSFLGIYLLINSINRLFYQVLRSFQYSYTIWNWSNALDIVS